MNSSLLSHRARLQPNHNSTHLPQHKTATMQLSAAQSSTVQRTSTSSPRSRSLLQPVRCHMARQAAFTSSQTAGAFTPSSSLSIVARRQMSQVRARRSSSRGSIHAVRVWPRAIVCWWCITKLVQQMPSTTLTQSVCLRTHMIHTLTRRPHTKNAGCWCALSVAWCACDGSQGRDQLRDGQA